MKKKLLIPALLYVCIAALAISSATYSEVFLLDTVDPMITIQTPNGGEQWYIGETYEILWSITETNLAPNSVYIAYRSSGDDVLPIAEGIANTGSWAWTIPENPGYDYNLVLAATDTFGNFSLQSSQATFSLISIQALSPQGVTVAVSANGDAVISWQPVSQTIHGSPIEPDGYIVLYSEAPHESSSNLYNYLGDVSGSTSFTHTGIAQTSNQMYYRVVAYKNVEGRMPSVMAEVRANPNPAQHTPRLVSRDEEPDPNAPALYNVSVAQRTDGSKLVDIFYDLLDPHDADCEISLQFSEDGGYAFDIHPTLLSGDIGENVTPGVGKHIVWDAGSEARGFDGNSFVARFEAENGFIPMPENFLFVEGGTIYPSNGSFTSGLTVNSFYIDKYEVTTAEWEAVMGSGGGNSYPKASVSWYSALEYCNRRSMQEGLSPAYSYLSFGTDPADWPSGWNTLAANHVNLSCDFSVNGYRLLTEAEWEFAARGGLQTQGFLHSGSNTLDEVGWYNGNSGYNAHQVGQLASNELGTFDMNGNLWEWTWSRYTPVSPSRTVRGGAYGNNANFCTVATRANYSATFTGASFGFRICRTNP